MDNEQKNENPKILDNFDLEIIYGGEGPKYPHQDYIYDNLTTLDIEPFKTTQNKKTKSH